MTVPLPNVAEAINAGGPASVAWRNWFQAINARFQAGDLSTAELQAAVADIQAQLAELGGGNVAQGEGIAVYGSLADTLTIALRALGDDGAGTFKLLTRDDYGRLSGTADGDTDDVPEGLANLYFTNERAQDAVGTAIAAGTGDGATLSYNDAGNAIGVTNTDKGSVAVAAHEAAADPHPQYATAAEAKAAAVSDAITNGVTDVAPSQNAVFDALAGKEPTIAAGTTAQVWRGDKAWANRIDGPFGVGPAAPGILGFTNSFTLSSAVNCGYEMASTRADANNVLVGAFTGIYQTNSAGHHRICDVQFTTEGATPNQRGGTLGFYTKADASTSLVKRWSVTNTGHLEPSSDNTYNLGAASLRAKELFCANSVINTSDAREKTAVAALSTAEIAAAKALAREVGSYQWRASLAAKGAAARQHIGMTVQRCIEIMSEHGLDAMRYGFVCYDRWDEKPEVVETWEAQDEVRDDDGNIVRSAREAGSTITQAHIPAGDRYSFRMDQLCLFIAAGFEARLAALEAAH